MSFLERRFKLRKEILALSLWEHNGQLDCPLLASSRSAIGPDTEFCYAIDPWMFLLFRHSGRSIASAFYA